MLREKAVEPLSMVRLLVTLATTLPILVDVDMRASPMTKMMKMRSGEKVVEKTMSKNTFLPLFGFHSINAFDICFD